MWLFLGSECLLFGGLISTYMLYRGRHSENLGPDQMWDIPFTSASSFVLLMSSLTMVLAVTAARRRDDRNTKVWLCVTALLGSLFVAGQVYEFTTFYREGLGFTTSLFSSSFYTLTGFHGVHVSVGIVILLSVVGMIARGRTPSRQVGGGRDRRPLLALRRHRVDPDLHPRLPDPRLSDAMTTDDPPRALRARLAHEVTPARRRTTTSTHWSDLQYIKLALALAVITGARGRAELHEGRLRVVASCRCC